MDGIIIKKLMFLGIDRNDLIYMGELNGDKIATIIYGKVNEITSAWKKVTIDSREILVYKNLRK